MENLLLRKLTRKSVIGFGEYKDLTAGNLLDMNRVRELLQLYYALSKIDFADCLKSELCMTEELSIKKPGKGYGRFDWRINKVMAKYIDTLTEKQRQNNVGMIVKESTFSKSRQKAKYAISSTKEYSKQLNMTKVRKGLGF